MEPERRAPGSDGTPEGTTPEERRRVARAAALRPMNLLVIVIGVVSFAATLAWWVPLLTLATYAALVFLGARDPFLRRRVLGERVAAPPPVRAATGPRANGAEPVSPDRRARWLPRGETRQRVEEALEAHRRVLSAIEDSDEVTRAVLKDSVPKLRAVADRLVDVAESREKAAEATRDLRRGAGANRSPEAEESHRALEEKVRTADAEISETTERLQTLRAKVVRFSLDAGNPDRSTALDASLDEINARLEALNDTMSSPQ